MGDHAWGAGERDHAWGHPCLLLVANQPSQWPQAHLGFRSFPWSLFGLPVVDPHDPHDLHSSSQGGSWGGSSAGQVGGSMLIYFGRCAPKHPRIVILGKECPGRSPRHFWSCFIYLDKSSRFMEPIVQRASDQNGSNMS